jgi:protein O-GlcNAc transferase
MDINETITSAIESHQAGNFQKAENIYKEILSVQPDNFYALHYLGVLYSQLGNYDPAVGYIEKAIEVNPSDAHAYYNLGIAFQGKGCLDKAITSYQKSLQLNPSNADAYVNLGITLKEKGQLDGAITSYQKALQLNPNLIAAMNNLGIALKEKGRLNDSITLYQKALQIYPNSADILHNFGIALQEKGQLDDAINSYQKALQLKPHSADILFNLGTALMEQGKQNQAIAAFDKVLDYDHDSFITRFAHCVAQLPIFYHDPSNIQISRKRYKDELITLRDTIILESQQAIENAAKAVGVIQPFYLAYQGLNDLELQQIYGNLVCRIMALKYPQFAEYPSMPPLISGNPIRIGFVSGYFYNHSVWKIPTRGWIENLDKTRFELYGYYTWKNKDDETAVARRYFKRFIEDVHSFEDLCSIIRRDNLHILIFPEIGMDPIAFKLASLKLAPVQCASWGHPTTTGLPTIDYYFSSELMEPPDAENHYSEQLVRLPNLSMYYTPADMIKEDVDRETFSIRPDSVVYHCCQLPFKYLPQYDEVFPRIAQEIGNCQFLFGSYPKSNWITEQFHMRLNNAFKKFGLRTDDFIVFLPFLDSSTYNALYDLSDVFLDPIGWSGCNSALEAISCNLPVVTFPCELMRSRDSFAILTMMNVKETIASSLDEYVALAVKLGKDPELRQNISKKIADNKHHLYHDRTCLTALENFFERASKERLSKSNDNQ